MDFAVSIINKVRDEAGNLLVVYHGTDADFNVFDRTKGRSTMDIQGSFFSPWEIDAKGYGSKVGRYYLNIKKPAPESVAYRSLNRFKGQNEAGIKARDYLERLGYDGVNNSDEEYIAFNSNQIKRIDNKTPTENEDVRFSFRDRIQYSPTDARGNVTVSGDVSPEEVRNALQTIYDDPNGNHDYTIPVLKESPYVYEYATGIPGKRSFVMHASKAAQAMLNRNAKDHNLGVNGLMQVIGKLKDPDYIIYQRAGQNEGHYIAIVTVSNKEAVAAVEIDNYRMGNGATVNGETGFYNVLITAYDKLDKNAKKKYASFDDYICNLIDNDYTEVVYDKEKDEEAVQVALRETLSRHAMESSPTKSISRPDRKSNTFGDSYLEIDMKPSLRNPTDAELIFNATGENVGEREQIASFKKTSLAYENAARSEAIVRVKVQQKKATPAELAEARRRTATIKDRLEEERKALVVF